MGEIELGILEIHDLENWDNSKIFTLFGYFGQPRTLCKDQKESLSIKLVATNAMCVTETWTEETNTVIT